MNLYEPLPCAAAGCAVHTDFRAWLGFYEAWQRSDIVGMMRVYKVLPPHLDIAVSAAAAFCIGSTLPYKTENAKSTDGKAVDFLFDNQLIYAAFMAQYGINLNTARLHWYEFCALFHGLNGQTINSIMEYRTADANKISDKNRRREMARLKRLYALPDNRTVEQRDRDNAADIARLF